MCSRNRKKRINTDIKATLHESNHALRTNESLNRFQIAQATRLSFFRQLVTNNLNQPSQPVLTIRLTRMCEVAHKKSEFGWNIRSNQERSNQLTVKEGQIGGRHRNIIGGKKG